MHRSIFCRYLCLIALALWATSVLAADSASDKADKADKKEEKKPAAAAPATKTVEKGPFRIVVELEGVFEGEKAYEILLSPEEWSKLTVLSAARHGAHVRKGDVVLELETDKLDRTITDLQAKLKLSEVAIHQAEEQLQVLGKITPLNLESSRRAAKIAEEDREFFFRVGRPLSVKVTEFGLKMARTRLEYQQEELRQLEKMYKADDITEETEEIVLQRARDALERAKFSVEIAEINRDFALKFDIPRREEQVEESTRRSVLDWEKSESKLPLALKKQRLDLEKLREQRRKSEEKLEKLLADRKGMTVRSPAAGIVYYGRFTRGKPADSSAMESRLRLHGTVQPNQVVMTVVSPRPMCIRTTVPEKYLHDLRPGLKGTAVPTGYPDLDLPVEVDRVSDIPIAPGKFDGWLKVRLKGKSKLLMPGMTCKIKLVPYLKRDAILVPPKVIVTDELDDRKRSVQVLGEDGKPKTRPVTIGRRTDKQVEILKGLQEGEKVVLEPSKNKE